MEPVTIAGLVSGLGSLGAAILGRRDNAAAAQMNAKQYKRYDKINRRRQLHDYQTARRDQRADIKAQYVRLREAADLGGFNPLSVIGTGINAGVSMGGGGFTAPPTVEPPLASNAFLANALQGVSDLVSGKDAAELAETKARTELMRVEAERMKSLVPIGGNGATAQVTPAGGKPPASLDPDAPWEAGRPDEYHKTGNAVDDDREVDRRPMDETAMFMEVGNDLLGDGLYIMGSDGEPMGIDEHLAFWPQVVPQLAYRRVKEYHRAQSPEGRAEAEKYWSGVYDRFEREGRPQRFTIPSLGITPREPNRAPRIGAVPEGFER